MAWRIALGGLIHETHSFADIPTTLADFQSQALHYGDSLLSTMRGTRSAIGGLIEGATTQGWTLLPTVYGAAMPGGIVTAEAYQTILRKFLDRLSASLPVDGILLALHGAMVTADQLDPESDILEKVRRLVGPDTPIVAVLDMHGNISARTVELADILVAFETNPHLDPRARGLEAVDLLARMLRQTIKPTPAYVHPPLLLAPQATGASDLPLRAVHTRAAEMKTEAEVLSICVMAGFAYADTPFSGASLIVTTANNPVLAQGYAQDLANLLMQQRQAALPQFLPPEVAVRQALALPGGPIILVDSADNVGGGTPGDGAEALRAMLELEVREGTIVLADAEAVTACWTAGHGAEVSLSVGGKTDQWHGRPVAVTGVVRALSNGIFECEQPDNHFAAFFGQTINMGRTVWLRATGVNIILTERKIPPFDLAQLRGVGVNPEQQKMIVVKSAVAYRAAYLPIATGVIEMDTPGLCSANLARFPYRHLSRPIFPLDV
ncbi:MAG: M81 family metallopeptidase [Anaerolineae bacterium]